MNKESFVKVRLTKADHTKVKARAENAALPISTYIRFVLLGKLK